MDFMMIMTPIHKLILTNKYLRYTPFWWWWKLMSHEGFRFDDYYVWGEFWHSLNAGWNDMEYSHNYFKVWSKVPYSQMPKKDNNEKTRVSQTTINS